MSAILIQSDCSTPIAAAQSRILIVDDQIEVAEFLAEMLRLVGYEAVTESNPQKALERIEDENFDLIISDFKMPELSGFEFYQAVLSVRPAMAARFVFLTGDLFNFETESLLRSSGVPVMTKPFRLAAVEQMLAGILASAAAA
jgi:CheY-like chemotaxis protein